MCLQFNISLKISFCICIWPIESILQSYEYINTLYTYLKNSIIKDNHEVCVYV